MQRKLAILLWAFSALISFNSAYAQSSHDAASGPDPDLSEGANSDLSIGTADGNYKLRLRGHVQENNQFHYFTKGGKRGVDVEIKRARMSVLGNAINPRLTYLFQVGYERDPKAQTADVYTSPGSEYLRDYYFNMAFNEELFHVRVGKFRTPFSRQQLMSTSQMQFFDQNHANDEFQLTNSGRDVGIMFHNGYANPFEWALAAVSNGVVARLGYNYNGIDGYEFADFKGGDFRFAVAANGYFHTDYMTARVDDVRGGADFVAKVAGFSTNGAFYYQYAKKSGQSEGNKNLGGGLDLGFLIDKKFEPVARYSWVKYAGDGSPHQHEILAGLNYYVYGHHLKVQGYGGSNVANKEIVKWLGGVQFQFAL